MSEAGDKNLVLTLCIEERNTTQHSHVEVVVPISLKYEEREIVDALQRAVNSAFTVVKSYSPGSFRKD